MIRSLVQGISMGLLLWGSVHAQTHVDAYAPTPWTSKVNNTKPLNNYPRPQLTRSNWQNLNGKWKYAISDKTASVPSQWDGDIIVPFPLESYLSGVHKKLDKQNKLWYQRKITVKKKKDTDILFHIGASDWETTIYVNGTEVSTHRGGYVPIEINIGTYLKDGENEITISCWDPTDEGEQARGKQVSNPSGIYYTSVTGIWQTVWLEEVPLTYVKAYNVVSDIEKKSITVTPEIVNPQPGDQFVLSVKKDGRVLAEQTFTDVSASGNIDVAEAKLWTPEHPELYDIYIAVKRGAKVIDKVKGYFGMRKIEVTKDDQGVLRPFLNNKPVFMYGPLDQGYWPDGIYTAPTDEALQSDIKRMKQMGFNTVRKHVKVEPARWYYHCDVAGLLVWQDMPSGYAEIVPVKDHDHSIENDWLARHYKDLDRSATSEQLFRDEWKAIMKTLNNHPSIVVWVPFNESWGQFRTNEILSWTKQLDPTRLVDGPSGWIDRGEGELRDYHLYGNRLDTSFSLERTRGLVIGEFGGLGWTVPGHTMQKDSWGYSTYKSGAELLAAYGKLIDRIAVLKQNGFSAAIYTQLTDVETEVNGIITYDRFFLKMSPEALNELHKKLYQ